MPPVPYSTLDARPDKTTTGVVVLVVVLVVVVLFFFSSSSSSSRRRRWWWFRRCFLLLRWSSGTFLRRRRLRRHDDERGSSAVFEIKKSFLLLLLLVSLERERERERESLLKAVRFAPSLIGFRRRRQKAFAPFASFLRGLNVKRNWDICWIYFTTVVFCCVFFRREREKERESVPKMMKKRVERMARSLVVPRWCQHRGEALLFLTNNALSSKRAALNNGVVKEGDCDETDLDDDDDAKQTPLSSFHLFDQGEDENENTKNNNTVFRIDAHTDEWFEIDREELRSSIFRAQKLPSAVETEGSVRRVRGLPDLSETFR